VNPEATNFAATTPGTATHGGDDLTALIFDCSVEERSIINTSSSGVELVEAITKKRLQLGPLIMTNVYLDTRQVMGPRACTAS